MAGIQLSGLSSGLDTGSIIDSLMAIERQPRQRLSYRQVAEEARKTALSDIQTKLSSLKNAATALSSTLTWVDTQSVAVSDSAKIGATRTSGVGPGSYQFVVTQMASAARNTYTYSAPPVHVQLRISSGTSTSTITLPTGATIDDTVALINADSATGVFAVKVGSDLVLSSRTTGLASAITVEADAGGGFAAVVPSATVAGKDAQYTIDGGAPQTSATNTITNAIPGLDVTLKGLTDGTGVSVTVGNPSPDTSGIKDKLKAFVSAYNDALTLIKAKYEEAPVKAPANNVDAAKGVLRSDSTLSAIMTAMRGGIAGEVSGADSSLNLLSQIGVSTGAAVGSGTLNQDAITGKLTFDEATFDSAYAANPTKVRQLLGGTGSAFGQAFSAAIDVYSSSTGVLGTRVTQADSAIQTVKDSLAAFDRRLEARQAYLQTQFQQMEAAMSQSRAVSAQLSAQITALGR